MERFISIGLKRTASKLLTSHANQHNKIITRQFVLKRKGTVKKSAPRPKAEAVALRVEEAWVSVKDEASGKIYWWNQMTNETTALDAPKPLGATAIQPAYAAQPPAVQGAGSMLGGIGGMVAQGMAFGAGSSMAHHAIGSIFGGSSSSSGGSSDPPPMSGDSGLGGSDDGSWDV